MARVNQWAFRGQLINSPYVRVRDITGQWGLPPLRGENFLTYNATGRLFVPKIHDEKHITLELLVRDTPSGMAAYVFDQLDKLFANRSQGALANILDSGTRTGQAECVAWDKQDLTVSGAVYSGVVDFLLADPYLYGSTVTGTVVPAAGLSFGTPVINQAFSPSRANFTLSMTGVVSGQPILVAYHASIYPAVTTNISTITDTFGTPYTWTKVDGYLDASVDNDAEIWIGTGGVGTSGVITVTPAHTAACGGAAVPMIGASTAAGLLAIDVHNCTNYSTSGISPSPPAISVTPTASGEGALLAANSFGTPATPPTGETTHFTLVSGGTNVTIGSEFLYPTSGVALSPTYGNYSNWINVAAVVKGSGAAPASVNITNPGTVRAEKITLDILGPATNPTISNTTNGYSLTINTAVAGGQHLIIDTGAYTAVNNGVSVIGSLVHTGGTAFMALETGVNTLTAIGSGCTGASLLTVSFATPYV